MTRVGTPRLGTLGLALALLAACAAERGGPSDSASTDAPSLDAGEAAPDGGTLEASTDAAAADAAGPDAQAADADPRDADAQAVDAAAADATPREPYAWPTRAAGPWALAGLSVPAPRTASVAAACRVDVAPPSMGAATPALRAALAEAGARAADPSRAPDARCVVALAPGTYAVDATLEVPSGVTLSGAGAGSSVLAARFGGRAAPVIVVRGDGRVARAHTGLDVGGYLDERSLTAPVPLVEAAAALLAADGTAFVHVEIENDPAKLPARWARDYGVRAQGQLARVVAAAGTTLTLDRPLDDDYPIGGAYPVTLTLHPRAAFARDVVIEALTVDRVDDVHASTIELTYAADVRVARVEAVRTGWAHLAADLSLSLEIVESWFHGAHGFGDGGRGYGVNLRRHVTGARVEDNVLEDLRHALILQIGANGNVVAFNLSRESHDDLGFQKADVSLHGHYAHRNLIEGNDVEMIHVSDWWGPTPAQTVFANVVRRGGITVDDGSEGVVVVDNRSAAAVALRAPLTVDASVRLVFCLANVGLDGAPLAARHARCDDENLPSADVYAPRPASLSRAAPLRTAAGELPALARWRSGRPIP